MTGEGYGPLIPKPQDTVCIAHTERGITSTCWRTPGRPYYTAEQLRAYGESCGQAAIARTKAQPGLEMTDKALLEAAANASGLKAQWDCVQRGLMVLTPEGNDTMTWNPLHSDGDAFRLAVQLHMTVRCYMGTTVAQIGTPGLKNAYEESTDHANPAAATRRAITRAAASVAPP